MLSGGGIGMAIALGIDTGGTYTDAVLVDFETGHVLSSAKALTTKHDLAVGIREAMGRVLSACPADVRLVSLSTTLATNAIVEGNGAPICALLIGYEGNVFAAGDLERDLGTRRYACIEGGHSTEGEEIVPVDLATAEATILEHAPHVAAYAISGYFGTRNPAHELAVKALVSRLTGKPATCGHELTHRLDALRRATTVALNARLIPLICDLIDAVEITMREQGIDAPLMVVKGDGSLMESSMARERPIETILSGPAASVVGAQHLALRQSGKDEDVVVVDMGGTTTDIAVITDGHPRLSPQGAQVGPWRTMVEAIDVHTVGIGGDSRVWLDEAGEMFVGPRRVVPIALLGMEHPEILAVLGEQVRRPELLRSDGEFLLLQRQTLTHDGEHPGFEDELLVALQQGPCPLERVYRIMRHPLLYARYLEHLERQGILLRAGFTPSDAAHILGKYCTWDAKAAHLSGEIMARRVGVGLEALCEDVLSRTSRQIAEQVVYKLLADDGHDGHCPELRDSLIASALRPKPSASLQVAFTVRPTLVAIGAPVHTYFPAVSNALHCSLRIPEHTEVANAVGAVAGSVVSRAHMLIVPVGNEEGFRVHLPDHVRDARDLDDALAYAEEHGRLLAESNARRAGAEDIRTQVERSDHRAPVAEGFGQELFIQTDMTVTSIGRPRLAKR